MENTNDKEEFLKDILKEAYPQNDSVDASRSKRGQWHFWEGVDNPMQHGSGAKCQLTDEVVDILIKRRNQQSTSQKETIERLRETLDGLLDDFKYYISQMEEEPQRAGYMLEAEQLLSTTEPIDQNPEQ